MTKDFISYSKDKKLKYFVSIGGEDEYKGTIYDNKIKEGINAIEKEKIPLYTRLVYSTKSNEGLSELLERALQDNIKYISAGTIFGEYGDENDINKFEKELIKFAELYLKEILENNNFHNIGIHPFASYIQKWLIGKKYDVNQCGAGKDVIAISTEGIFYPCHCFVGHEKFNSGNLWDGYNPLFKEYSADTINSCKNCDIKYFCKARCYADSYYATGDIINMYKYRCDIERLIVSCSAYILKEIQKHKKHYKIFKFLMERSSVNNEEIH